VKQLSNSDLRTLYLRRNLLQQVVQTISLHVSGNVGDSWQRELKRVQCLYDEIKEILDDPQFERIIPRPGIAHPRPNTYSSLGTLVNAAATAKELVAYLDSVLGLYLAPKARELAESGVARAKVFIGHGRNEVVRQRLKNFIGDRCGLEPIVLQDLPSSGLTVIEKLEKYGRVADFAVLILTGDDLQEHGEVRARQNVIQELGWFQGVLGRQRTAVLLQSGVAVPSNIGGVVYIEFQAETVESTFENLRAEFEAAGILGRSG